VTPLAEMMALWARAWAISRHVAPPEPVAGGGWRIEVGKADQRRRYLFDTCNPDVLGPLAAEVSEPFVFIKCCTDEATLRAALPPAWGVRQLGYMMRDEQPEAYGADLPPGYQLTAFPDNPPSVRAEVRVSDGELAASGQIILIEDMMVYDQIVTTEGHRRRGLGRALMDGLKRAGLDAGARSGVLSATLMGRGLYRSLGWTEVSDYTTGASPGTEPFT
jgi:GNAT superfamily N-acetyltransferase